jgi:hypothetical protein
MELKTPLRNNPPCFLLRVNTSKGESMTMKSKEQPKSNPKATRKQPPPDNGISKKQGGGYIHGVYTPLSFCPIPRIFDFLRQGFIFSVFMAWPVMIAVLPIVAGRGLSC